VNQKKWSSKTQRRRKTGKLIFSLSIRTATWQWMWQVESECWRRALSCVGGRKYTGTWRIVKETGNALQVGNEGSEYKTKRTLVSIDCNLLLCRNYPSLRWVLYNRGWCPSVRTPTQSGHHFAQESCLQSLFQPPSSLVNLFDRSLTFQSLRPRCIYSWQGVRLQTRK
jgi:hypothetical protein